MERKVTKSQRMSSDCNSFLLIVGWSTISSRYASWKWFIRQGNPRYLASSPSNSYTGHTSTAILAKSRQGTSWKPKHVFLQWFLSSSSNPLLCRTFARLHFLPPFLFLFFFLSYNASHSSCRCYCNSSFSTCFLICHSLYFPFISFMFKFTSGVLDLLLNRLIK